MDSLIVGGVIGIILALLNVWGSTIMMSRITFRSKVTSVIIALGGFVLRLTLLSIIFCALHKSRAVHFQTVLVTFIACFTVCLFFKGWRFYRTLNPLLWKQNGR